MSQGTKSTEFDRILRRAGGSDSIPGKPAGDGLNLVPRFGEGVGSGNRDQFEQLST